MIQIRLFSDIKNIQIDVVDNKVVILNGKKANINVDMFVVRLLSIVEKWDPFLIDNSVVGGVSYSVVININGKEKRYEGKNKFPDNFYAFTNLLEEVK